MELLKPFWDIIAKWGGIVAGIVLVLFKARQAGEQAMQRKQAMETLKSVQTRDKIENGVNTDNASKLARLHKKWTK